MAEKEKRDVRKEVTDALIRAIEEGKAPWQQPFEGGPREAPINAVTGRPYTGGNHLWLSMVAPSADPRWCTYKQAQEQGWQVRKGEQGVPIEVWKTYEKKLEPRKYNKELGKLEKDLDGEEHTEQRRFAKVYTVFHASQIEGIPPYEIDPAKTHEFDLHAVGERLFDRHEKSAEILFDTPGAGFYQPSTDRIHLPPRDQFLDAGHLYATAAHEIAHSTMHPTRLNRERYKEWEQGTAKGDKVARAKEELRAEIASYIISEKTGIPHHPENHESYVAGWVSILQNDKNEIYRAAREAEQIADYVIAQQRLLEVETPERSAEKAVLRETTVQNVVSSLESEGKGMNTKEVKEAKEVKEDVVVLTHRKDLKVYVDQEYYDSDNTLRKTAYHPRQKISGVLTDFSKSAFYIENAEFGNFSVETFTNTIDEDFGDKLRTSLGKPVDIAFDDTGKILSVTVHDGKDVSVFREEFERPLKPFGLMPIEQTDRKSAVEISGKLTHVHDTNMIELKTETGPVLVFAQDPDKAHQREIQGMIGHEVVVKPGKTLTVIDLTPEKGVEKAVSPERTVEKETAPEKTPEQVRHNVVLTHREDLKDRVVQSPDKPLKVINHPAQKISGILKDFTKSEFVLDNSEFGTVKVATNKFLSDSTTKYLQEAVGKPVDISIDKTGKVLTMKVPTDLGVRVVQDRFQTPVRPYGLMPLERMDREGAKEVSGTLKIVHGKDTVELRTDNGPVLVTGPEPDKQHQHEIFGMIGREVVVKPGKTLTVVDRNPPQQQKKLQR